MDKNKKYLLGMYEKALPTYLTWEEKFLACKEAGFDWIEMSIDETDEKISRLDWSEKEKDEFINLMKRTGVQVNTICFSAQRKYSLGSLDENKHQTAMNLMEKVVDFANYLGVRIVQLAGYDCYYEQSCDKSREEFIKNLKIATEMAAKKGVLLGFETMMDRTFIDTVEKGMEFVNMCASPFLGMYPDIGNLAAAKYEYGYSKSLSEDIETGKGHIFAAHLKETAYRKDRSNPWGTGLTEYVSCIRKLKELGVRMFNGEFWCDHPDDWQNWIKQSNEFLRDKLDRVFDEDEN